MKQNLIYFLISDFPDLYDDALIYFAEGLTELGISFYANRNYWQINLGGDYLFKEAEINSREFNIVILSNHWTEYIHPKTFQNFSKPLPKWLFNTGRKYKTVYIDAKDDYKTFSYSKEARKFDYILRTKKNYLTFNPQNIHPWVLGFQKRICYEKKAVAIEDKKFQMAVNFGYSHPYAHSLRTLAEKNFISKFPKQFINRYISERKEPEDPFSKLMFKQTNGLHNLNYFLNIEQTLLVAAFCGDLIPGLPHDPSVYLIGGNKAKIKKEIFTILSNLKGVKQRIIQWDSWRFWETLALGSVPIHIDLEKYGVELPIMPLNWKHYIGIDLDNINQTIERVIEEKDAIYKIAKEGNEWCMINYSPEASAKRFLKTIGLSSEIQETSILIIKDSIK